MKLLITQISPAILILMNKKAKTELINVKARDGYYWSKMNLIFE